MVRPPADEGDLPTVGRPAWENIHRRVRCDPVDSWRSDHRHVHIDVRSICLTVPGERHLVAIRREARHHFIAVETRHRPDLHRWWWYAGIAPARPRDGRRHGNNP